MKYISFEPAAFLEGVIELSLEERGFYITLIALNYARAKKNGSSEWQIGDVTDDLVIKAAHSRRDVWRRAKASLIAKGKIIEINGKLVANRVETEIKRVTKLQVKSTKSRTKVPLFEAHIEQNQELTPMEGKGKKKDPSKKDLSSDGKGKSALSARSLPLDALARSPPPPPTASDDEIRAWFAAGRNGK